MIYLNNTMRNPIPGKTKPEEYKQPVKDTNL